MTFSLTLSRHLVHPLTWALPNPKGIDKAQEKTLLIPHSLTLWAPALAGGVSLPLALYNRGKRDYRVLIAGSLLTITALFYLTTYLIKSFLPDLSQQIKDYLKLDLREEKLQFMQEHGGISPVTYLAGYVHDANRWKAQFHGTTSHKHLLLSLISAQNAIAWNEGYQWAEEQQDCERGENNSLSYGTPFTQVHLKDRVFWDSATFYQDPSIVDGFIDVGDDLLDAVSADGQELNTSLYPNGSSQQIYPTDLTITSASPIEAYRTLAAIQTQVLSTQEPYPACPPVILTLCPHGRIVQPDLARRTALAQITNRYFCPDLLASAKSQAQGLALYVPGVPCFRGSEADGYPFLQEPLPLDVLCVYHDETPESLEEGVKSALRCALNTNPHYKKKAFCDPPLVYKHLIIPIDGSNVQLWHSLFSNQAHPEFLSRFAQVHFVFSDDAIYEAFYMTYQQLSEPPPPPPPSMADQAASMARNLRPSEGQKAAALAAGRTLFDASSQGLRFVGTLAGTAARSASEYLNRS